MNGFVSRLTRTRLGNVLGVFLAGCLLFVSTACGAVQAKTPDSPNSTPQQNNPAKAYDIRQTTPEGGMNRYSDVDPRRGDIDASAKAKALVDSSKRNLTRSNEVVENVKDAADDVSRSAARSARDLTNKAGNVVDDAASSVKNAADNVVQGARDLTNKAGNAVDDAARSARNATNQTGNAVDNTARKLSRDTERLVNQAPDRTAAQAQKVKENLYEATQQAKEAAERTVN